MLLLMTGFNRLSTETESGLLRLTIRVTNEPCAEPQLKKYATRCCSRHSDPGEELTRSVVNANLENTEAGYMETGGETLVPSSASHSSVFTEINDRRWYATGPSVLSNRWRWGPFSARELAASPATMYSLPMPFFNGFRAIVMPRNA
ncbi:unnamed protein product [Lasius platythorax]|uniref:Uncharacterized protein n=1 Tax=Lasius platythorax TaxID=488582 RepID=A0AAV2N2C1_9HYME